MSWNEPNGPAVVMFVVDDCEIGRAVTVQKAENATRIRVNSLNAVRI